MEIKGWVAIFIKNVYNCVSIDAPLKRYNVSILCSIGDSKKLCRLYLLIRKQEKNNVKSMMFTISNLLCQHSSLCESGTTTPCGTAKAVVNAINLGSEQNRVIMNKY